MCLCVDTYTHTHTILIKEFKRIPTLSPFAQDKKKTGKMKLLFRDLYLGDNTIEEKGGDFHTNESSYWLDYLWGEGVMGKDWD